MHRFGVAAIAMVAWIGTPAMGATIFSTDFESGIGANESITAVSGGFGLTDTSPLGNGTTGIGHTSGYANNFGTIGDFYQVIVDLTDVTGARLAFDYNVDTELLYDEFGVIVGADAGLQPIGGFVPNDFFDFNFGAPAISGEVSGRAVFDLSPFDGQSDVQIRIVLAPDSSLTEAGFFIDNVDVTGVTGVVPLPAPALLLLSGLAALAMARRRG